MTSELNQRKSNNEGDWDWFNQFCGIEMSSNYYVFHIFSEIIKHNPQITKIVELGTYTGSMSIALGLLGVLNNKQFITYDIKNNTKSNVKELLINNLGVLCENKDIHDLEIRKQIFKEHFNEPIYLLCDNGNKRGEFIDFVPQLKSSSVVSVHDYGVEFYEEDWKIHENILTPFNEVDWMKHNVQLATWVVK